MVNRRLEQIRIVLVEPAGPLNVGAIARVMKNFGLRQLSHFENRHRQQGCLGARAKRRTTNDKQRNSQQRQHGKKINLG